MTLQLGTVAALAEDPGLVLSTYIMAHTSLTQFPGYPVSFSCLWGTRHTLVDSHTFLFFKLLI